MRNDEKTHERLPAWEPPSPATNRGFDSPANNDTREAPRSRSVVRWWAIFGICTATMIVVMVLAGGSVSFTGLPAVLLMLLFFSVPLSFLVAVVVTVSTAVRGIADELTAVVDTPDGPQDAPAPPTPQDRTV